MKVDTVNGSREVVLKHYVNLFVAHKSCWILTSSKITLPATKLEESVIGKTDNDMPVSGIVANSDSD